MSSIVTVLNAGTKIVNGIYTSQLPSRIPAGFTITCNKMSWNDEEMWQRLSDLKQPWYEHENGSYIYHNKGDGKWWIDSPDGGGVYISDSLISAWQLLPNAKLPIPTVSKESVISEQDGL